MFTQDIQLLSGIKATIRLITGEMQEAFSRASGNQGDNINGLLKSLLVSLGSKTTITDKDIENLLFTDRQHLLVQARLASYDPETNIPIDWNETGVATRNTIQITEDIFVKTVPDKQYTEYSDLLANLNFEVELPVAKRKVQLTMLTNGYLQEFGAGLELKHFSLNTFVQMRKPRFVEVDEESRKLRLIQCDLKKLLARDIEFMRREIYKREGHINTVLSISHPTDKTRSHTIDLVSTIGFFFPAA